MTLQTRRLFFLLAGGFLFLFSCSSGGSSDTPPTEVDTDAFKSYKIDVDSDKTPFSDLVESVELMRLEETDEALLSYLGRFY